MDHTVTNDLLDRLVADYSDRLAAGEAPQLEPILAQVDPAHRAALERSLRMIDAGLARGPEASLAIGPGTVLDGYRLVREIGRGGMALVFLAVHEDLQREVALKILRPALALDSVHVDRFQREARSIARIAHPNILTVHDVGEARGLHYIVMEYIEGQTLADVLGDLPQDGAWTAEQLAKASGIALDARHMSREAALASILAPVAEALAAAHELGVVHRDVKPSNILIRTDGTPVVADFGLAKGAGDPGLSMTGDTLGTPYYMSPEQAGAVVQAVDHRTDVYSLGVTLYEALTGRRPFTGATALDVLEAIRHKAPPSLRSLSPRITRDTEALIRRAMARQPEHRYESARDLAEDLRHLAEGSPTRARLEEGGMLGRWRARRRMGVPTGSYERKSSKVFLGLPLYHVYLGRRQPGHRMRIAKAWFAVGDVAIGGLTLAPLSIGIVAVGGFSLGLLSLGGLASGLFAFGGMSVGIFACGGMAAGFLALGGMAVGYGAIGGMARGVHVMGGDAQGQHVITDRVSDPEAVEFFNTWVPWLMQWFQDTYGVGL